MPTWNWESSAWRRRTTTPPSAWPPGTPWRTTAGGPVGAELGDLAGAVGDFDLAILLAPGEASPYYNRGLTYAEMGEPLLAVEDLSRAMELESGQADAYYNRGLAYRDLGELERAVEDFGEAIALQQNYGLAHYARAVTGVNLGEFHAALRDFDAVIGLNPDDADALRGRAVALGSLGRYGEAVRDLDRSLEVDPGNVETLTVRAVALGSLGQHESAIEDYTSALELDPGNTALLFNRGISWIQVDRNELAIEDFGAVIEMDPDNAVCYRARALARMALGEHRMPSRTATGWWSSPRKTRRRTTPGDAPMPVWASLREHWRTSGAPSPWTRRTWRRCATGRPCTANWASRTRRCGITTSSSASCPATRTCAGRERLPLPKRRGSEPERHRGAGVRTRAPGRLAVISSSGEDFRRDGKPAGPLGCSSALAP